MPRIVRKCREVALKLQAHSWRASFFVLETLCCAIMCIHVPSANKYLVVEFKNVKVTTTSKDVERVDLCKLKLKLFSIEVTSDVDHACPCLGSGNVAQDIVCEILPKTHGGRDAGSYSMKMASVVGLCLTPQFSLLRRPSSIEFVQT